MPVLSSDVSQSYIETLETIWQGCSPTNASGEVIHVNAAHQWVSLGLYSSSGTWDLLGEFFRLLNEYNTDFFGSFH